MQWYTRWHGQRLALIDWIAGAAVFAVEVVEWGVGAIHATPVLIFGGAIVFGACVLFRRRAPMWMTIAVCAAFLASVAVRAPLDNNLASVVSPLLIIYSLSAASPLWRAVIGGVLLFLTLAVTVLNGFSGTIWAVVLVATPIIAGQAIRQRRILIEQLTAAKRELELSRDEEARRAVETERLRIARELHDMVAHSVSVMVVQATAAETTLKSDPPRALQAILAVQQSGRQALDELRRMLGMLRPDPSIPGSMTPQPGLDDLEQLLASMREAGLQVQSATTGEVAPLPAALDLTAYRIVQEALTNSLRHAGGQLATVLVRYEPSQLVIEVTNEPTGGEQHESSSVTGSGQGLIGMRERASLYGGQLEAGPTTTGGFAVVATLPIVEVEA